MKKKKSKLWETIKSYSPSNGEGIMAIYKWAVKLNSPRLACHDAAVKIYRADCFSPTINTQTVPSE